MLDNVKGLDEALRRRAEVEKTIADATVARARALSDEQRKADASHEQARLNAELAERARQQRYEDQSEVRNHEAGQLTRVIGGVPPVQPEPPLLTHDNEPPAEPPAAPVTPEPQPPAHPVREWLNHRPWWWWVVAILAANIVLAVVYPTWPTWPARGITTPSLRSIVVLIAVLWAVVHAAVGFTVGGLIAYRIEHRSRREH